MSIEWDLFNQITLGDSIKVILLKLMAKILEIVTYTPKKLFATLLATSTFPLASNIFCYTSENLNNSMDA